MSSKRSTVDAVDPGPKTPVSGMSSACSADHPWIVETILEVLRSGGNAVDAAVAACLAQTAIEPAMTNCAGTVTFLYWDAKTRATHQLNSMGTLVPHLPPFRPVPPNTGAYAPAGGVPPLACIPGFMAGLGEIHQRFGALPWSKVCEDAIQYAEDGHIVSSFEYAVNLWSLPFVTYFPAGRDLFCPGGFPIAVGKRFRNPALARTLRLIAAEGPQWMTTGGWARSFVETANQLGWPITMQDMVANPPRWGEPMRFAHRGHEIVQLAPPERQGIYCALVLGILKHLDYAEMEHLSADAIYAMSHSLRWAERETSYLHDPEIFGVPTDVWLDDSYHRSIARIIAGARPKVDLSRHMALTSSLPHQASSGILQGSSRAAVQPAGSCELSIVDSQGNWVQMMNTLQGGGIPGVVVEGVPMVGSSALLGSMGSAVLGLSLSGWLIPGSRIRSIIGNTLVFKDGVPWLGLGTPGKPDIGTVQVLSGILDHRLDPYKAIESPRMLPLADDFSVGIEDRIDPRTRTQLWSKGIKLAPMMPFEWQLGSFQVTWRDHVTGRLAACADPRRGGIAGGLR
jgi:gamma-glutamyltranspeptidase/glutathione hydrolase